MSRSRCTDLDDPASGGRPLGRRGVLLAALWLAPLAACGKKGPLELPPPEPFEEGADPLEDPETYGDPMTFPEPGEDEEFPE
jgi:predicted small lipoprotein YifL